MSDNWYADTVNQWRTLSSPSLIWKVALSGLSVIGLYSIFGLKSDGWLKSLFAKIGFNADDVDDEQLKLFKIMSAIRVLRLSYWALFQLNYGVTPVLMIVHALFETSHDLLTIRMYAHSRTKSADTQKWMNRIGLLLFCVGSFMESGHDFMLARFKSLPSSKGKIFTEGFAKYIAYPNYSGYCVWRTGQALLSGNIIYSSIVSAVWYSSFIFSGIPEKEAYLLKKYGLQYQKYIKNRSKLIPGIY
eukprot:482557_1